MVGLAGPGSRAQRLTDWHGVRALGPLHHACGPAGEAHRRTIREPDAAVKWGSGQSGRYACNAIMTDEDVYGDGKSDIRAQDKSMARDSSASNHPLHTFNPQQALVY